MSNKLFWSGKDALDRPVLLPRRPQRVISLVPSQTELLLDLGLGERLVGRTRYCVHPREKVSAVAQVGGTKQVDEELIESLKPDLFIAEKEENPKELVQALSKLAPVYVTDVVSIESAIAMCKDVGAIVGQTVEADSLALSIETAMDDVKGIARRLERVLYLIWRKPWMAAGQGSFIHSCLEWVGFENACKGTRYPALDAEKLASLAPDRVFLSSEPYPFKNTHAEEIQEILPNARIQKVDGQRFSWYGSRMLKMPDYWRVLVDSS
jgi:ABC-type Fe3+-hydroxamate transport system substrate-binding protein